MENCAGQAALPAAITKTGPKELEWTSHPLVYSHKKTAFLVSVVALTGVGIYFNTHSIFWSLFSTSILLAAVHDYLFPTRFRLSPKGAEIRFVLYRRQKTWSQLSSYYIDRNGVLLSPFPHPRRLDTFRGIYLRFACNREKVLDYVRSELDKTA